MVLQPAKHLPFLGDSVTEPSNGLRSELDKLGVEYLNLAPRLSRARQRQLLSIDGHPNRAGQALIAELVQEHITENAVPRERSCAMLCRGGDLRCAGVVVA